jgi:Peptidase family M28
MRPLETIRALAAFERRGPGTDAERRAAQWLARELIAQRHRVRVETFWCRPNWAMAHAWHVALALVGSLLAPSHPTAGAILLGIALASIVTDELTGTSPGRRLTPERASQNVVTTATASTARATTETPDARTPLIVTANYDAGRTALVYRAWLRRPTAYLGRVAGRAALGWLAWTEIAIAWLLAVAIVRTSAHHSSTALGIVQLPPTVVLLFGLALLLEAAGAPYGPAAGDNASGTAVAVALGHALATSAKPPDNVELNLVLAGAGEGGGIGIRRYLRSRRRELRRANAVVIGIAASGGGDLHCWLSDGPLIPLGYARPLRALAANLPGVTPHRDRGATPAFAARARGLAAIAIGCLNPRGLAPHSHQPKDVQATIDAAALDQTLDVTLRLIDAIDTSLARAQASATRPV